WLGKEAHRHVLAPSLGVKRERGDVGRAVSPHRYNPRSCTGKNPLESPQLVSAWAVEGILVFAFDRQRLESHLAGELGVRLDRGREPPQRYARDRGDEMLL